MAGAKGYSSYRGRGPRWKILLAVVLVVVIAVALSVVYLGEHVVYSADGRRQIVLPWQREERDAPPDGEEEDPDQPDVSVTVQEPEEQEPREIAAGSLPAKALTAADWTAWSGETKNKDFNAVAVRLKTSNGTIYFNFTGAVSGAVETELDTASTLSALTSREGLHTIASVACLQDFKAANADVEGRGLKNTGGYIFYDGNNNLWLDPAKPSTREYVCDLAKEIARLGFDELLLTDFSYPTVGKINKINYNTDVPLANNLDLLLGDLRTALEPYDILLSVEVPEAVIAEGPDTVAGLDLNRLAIRVDRIYAATTPEKVETLSALVTQAAGAEGTAEFVPELKADSPGMTGNRLILAE